MRSRVGAMQPSQFNLRVPLNGRNEVFLMETLTDAQLVVSPDVAALLDRARAGEFNSVGSRQSAVGSQSPADDELTDEEREALDLLRENGFLVDDRAADRHAL